MVNKQNSTPPRTGSGPVLPSSGSHSDAIALCPVSRATAIHLATIQLSHLARSRRVAREYGLETETCYFSNFLPTQGQEFCDKSIISAAQKIFDSGEHSEMRFDRKMETESEEGQSRKV